MTKQEKLERDEKYKYHLKTEWGYKPAYHLTEKQLKLAKKLGLSAWHLTEEELKEALSKHL